MNQPLTKQEQDWLNVHSLWSDWMRYEAADRGYDFKGAATARRAYDEAAGSYAKAYGESFREDTEKARALRDRERGAA